MNNEQKQRAIKLITYWRDRSITTMPEEHFVSGDCMTDLLQELIDAPEPEQPNQSEQHLEMVNPPAPSVPDGWLEILEAVLREMPARKGVNGNAPGHGHRIAGIWDDDNGPLSGKPCAWCMTWNKVKAMLAEQQPEQPEGKKIGCRCTYTDNQTVDTERLYHRAIRSERDRLRAELTAMREDLNDAAQCIARQRQTIRRLQDIEAAARNLAKVKGRHNSEIAMNRLLETLK